MNKRLAAGLLMFAGCVGQPPAQPAVFLSKAIAANQPPVNLMVLVDTSESMNGAFDGSTTRLAAVTEALGGFVGERSSLARFGLAAFPSKGTTCGATGAADILVPVASSVEVTAAERDANTLAMKAALAALTAGGASPGAASLRFFEGYAPFDAVEYLDSAVLLVTDGLDGCREADQAEAFKALRAKNIKTGIVAIGPDVTGPEGRAHFDALAVEGGIDASYANSRAELSAVLNTLLPANRPDVERCKVPLDSAPTSPAGLELLVDGAVEKNDWTVDGSVLRFGGAICERFLKTTVIKPMKVELRALPL